MPALSQLADPQHYRRCDLDLTDDRRARHYWIDVFAGGLPTLTRLARQSYPQTTDQQIESFAASFRATFAEVREHPERFERIDIYLLDELRTRTLAAHGFGDVFRALKHEATDAALGELPKLLREIDALPVDEQPDLFARGLLAGNFFDTGAPAAMERYRQQGGDFGRCREALKPRPWWRDSVDGWGSAWKERSPYAHVGFFVDNSGADIVLGVLPLVRWMVAQGARITLVANKTAALNDVTAPELRNLLDRMAGLRFWGERPPEGSGQLSIVDCGHGSPLVDLGNLNAECVAALRDADLLVLHGMGRSVESNYTARFTCDVLRTAVLKDPHVAERVGGTLFDCMFDYQRP